eukprot:479889-Rhodomonas_salina.1
MHSLCEELCLCGKTSSLGSEAEQRGCPDLRQISLKSRAMWRVGEKRLLVLTLCDGVRDDASSWPNNPPPLVEG